MCLSSCESSPPGTQTSAVATPYYVVHNDNTERNKNLTPLSTDLHIIPPPNIIKVSTGVLTHVDLGVPVVNNATNSVTVSNDAPNSGFPLGITQINWKVVDSIGTQATGVQTVMIENSLSCATKKIFFNQRIWPLLNTHCLECHFNNIVESPLNFVVNDVATNYEIMRLSSQYQTIAGESVFLSKINNTNNEHVGGLIFNTTSSEYSLIKNMIDRFSQCAELTSQPVDLVFANPLQQLRKTTLALTSRLPTSNEVQMINAATTEFERLNAFDNLLNNLLSEDAFYLRLKEIYGDLLLTDAYIKNNKALSLDYSGFERKSYFDDAQLMQQGYGTNDIIKLRRFANYGVSQSPLELILYVVKNNRPFTEILTADYMMVNPYSATLLGAVVVGQPTYNFIYGDNIETHDHRHFLPVKLFDIANGAIPHAGILTTPPFLARYPTSSTNANRKRARYILRYFLDLDAEGISNRGGLDLSRQIGITPTLEDPQCKICHDIVDPIAGLFKNWNSKGAFKGNNLRWLDKRQPPQMLPPGFANRVLPSSESGKALSWLSQQVSKDERFITATIKTLYKGITGIHSPIEPILLQQLQRGFIDSGFQLKSLVKSIVLSPSFLALNASQFSPGENRSYGTSHLLTPEQLDRKISAIFSGFEWRSPGKRSLLSIDSYRLLYGGIDYHDIIQRAPNTNSIIAGVQMRIANQLSCQTVPLDFSKPTFLRVLFPFVDIRHSADNPTNEILIRQNIQYLYQRILGEFYDANQLEVSRAYELFNSARALLPTESIVKDCQGNLLSTDPIVLDTNKTVRAWMAVVNFMLRDYKFLYE